MGPYLTPLCDQHGSAQPIVPSKKTRRNSMTEHRLLQKTACAAVVSAILAGIAGDAMAQAAPPDSGGIQEVIVTANRIAQPASKIPLALTVLSGDDLKAVGAVNASSLT
jgi:outer membrane receptor protein involved in Fe transport